MHQERGASDDDPCRGIFADGVGGIEEVLDPEEDLRAATAGTAIGRQRMTSTPKKAASSAVFWSSSSTWAPHEPSLNRRVQHGRIQVANGQRVHGLRNLRDSPALRRRIGRILEHPRVVVKGARRELPFWHGAIPYAASILRVLVFPRCRVWRHTGGEGVPQSAGNGRGRATFEIGSSRSFQHAVSLASHPAFGT